MSIPSFSEIDRARKLLGLGIKASLADIKKAYRHLVKKWHPDKQNKKGRPEDCERMKDINLAYKILIKYVENYRYEFTEHKINAENPMSLWEKQFGDDPTWGTGKGWE